MAFQWEPDDQDWDRIAELHPRRITGEQIRQFEAYVAEFFQALGLDLTASAGMDLPRRLVRMLLEVTDTRENELRSRRIYGAAGASQSAGRLAHLVEGPIHFFGTSERHVLPFHGHAYIGYLGGPKSVETPRLARLVRLFARRYRGQETLRNHVADAVEMILRPRGVAVYLETYEPHELHRVRDALSMGRATVWRGSYVDDSSLRGEFLAACA